MFALVCWHLLALVFACQVLDQCVVASLGVDVCGVCIGLQLLAMHILALVFVHWCVVAFLGVASLGVGVCIAKVLALLCVVASLGVGVCIGVLASPGVGVCIGVLASLGVDVCIGVLASLGVGVANTIDVLAISWRWCLYCQVFYKLYCQVLASLGVGGVVVFALMCVVCISWC